MSIVLTPPRHEAGFYITCLLQRGGRLLKPDVYVVRGDDLPMVVKDYRRYHGTFWALPARILVRHETEILRRLADWRHAPTLIGVSALAFSMEFIPGETLTQNIGQIGQEVFDQLHSALRRLHSRNITHNDLHGTNVIVSAGVPVLIDFASAWRSPNWLRNSFLCRQLRHSDWRNLLKLRQRVTCLASSKGAELMAEPRWIRFLRNGWKRFFVGENDVDSHHRSPSPQLCGRFCLCIYKELSHESTYFASRFRRFGRFVYMLGASVLPTAGVRRAIIDPCTGDSRTRGRASQGPDPGRRCLSA